MGSEDMNTFNRFYKVASFFFYCIRIVDLLKLHKYSVSMLNKNEEKHK